MKAYKNRNFLFNYHSGHYEESEDIYFMYSDSSLFGGMIEHSNSVLFLLFYIEQKNVTKNGTLKSTTKP